MKLISVDKLADDYLENALGFSECQYSSNFHLGNKYAKKLVKLGDKLRLAGNEGEEKLKTLMLHQNVHVRIWAASDSFPFSYEQAEKVLEDIINSNEGLIALTAKTTLSEWKKKKLYSTNDSPRSSD